MNASNIKVKWYKKVFAFCLVNYGSTILLTSILQNVQSITVSIHEVIASIDKQYRFFNIYAILMAN